MRLHWIAVSLVALGLSLPAMAGDVVINESGKTGKAGTDGGDGVPGAASPGYSIEGGTIIGDPGGIGNAGGDGTAGTDGTTGGTVSLASAQPTGHVTITVDGGAGGSGGKGGDGGDGGEGAASQSISWNVTGGKGGDGGDGGYGAQGGAGGAGGTIDLSIDAAVTGAVSLSASGGAGGNGGAGGTGGDGGVGGEAYVDYFEDYHAQGGDGGKGGDGSIAGAGGDGGSAFAYAQGTDTSGANGSQGQAMPEEYNGADGADGAGGTITVALSASVGGDVTANAGTGTVSVTLNTGASVGGTLSANEAANSALRFAMTVSSHADYKAAKAYLGDAANALSGSITIDGETFTWTGFDQLVQALIFAGVRSSGDSDRGLPAYLSCSPRAVTAFHQDGGIQLIASRTDERGAFRIGTVVGRGFTSQNDAGWTVRFDSGATGLRLDVLDPGGRVAATCIG